MNCRVSAVTEQVRLDRLASTANTVVEQIGLLQQAFSPLHMCEAVMDDDRLSLVSAPGQDAVLHVRCTSAVWTEDWTQRTAAADRDPHRMRRPQGKSVLVSSQLRKARFLGMYRYLAHILTGCDERQPLSRLPHPQAVFGEINGIRAGRLESCAPWLPCSRRYARWSGVVGFDL